MPNAWPATNDCMRIGWRSDPEWLHREDATTPDCDFSPRLCMVASSTSILCAKTVVERLFSVIPMRRVVRRQNDEFSDHSALRMSRYRAKDGIRAGCIELIGRGLGCSRRNVKVDPVLLAIRRLDDERVLDGANVGEFDPRGNPCSDLDSLRFETKPIEGRGCERPPGAGCRPRPPVAACGHALRDRSRGRRSGLRGRVSRAFLCPGRQPGIEPNQFKDAVESRKRFSGSVRIVAVCRFEQGIRDARDLLDRSLDACMFAGVEVA